MDERTLQARLKRLEDQVKLLSERAGVAWEDGSAGVPADVAQLVRDGKQIEAIKLYRVLTGADLADAKAAVERIR